MSNKNLEPIAFNFDATNQSFRSILIANCPWFVAKDVCSILQLSDTSKALIKLDDDEKLTRKIFGLGQSRSMWLVNESGLYNLIFRSNKPEAKTFRKWVTSEVLPAIRRKGGYEVEIPASDELGSLISDAAMISGSRGRLSTRLGVSAASISRIASGDTADFDPVFIHRISEGCKRILSAGNMVDMDAMDMLIRIEDSKVRTGLFNKMKKGGLL